ncbi:MAG: glycerol-3-phosphate responsive antiterminator [Pirellulales bacterium]|nr:glycerol-3-phosphate responsive antiterminator [Pirellulales bacterium]
MTRPQSIERCLREPVIPVVWEPGVHAPLIGQASTVFVQGGSLVELPRVVDRFESSELTDVALFAHIDLIAGLENSEAGLEYIASLRRFSGVVTVHHHLARPARQLRLKTIVRLFLSDSRAVERGVAIASKSQADAIEILPAAAAVKVAHDFAHCAMPRIAGGLCRTEADVREALASGCRAVTSTRPELWRLNGP